MKTIYLIYWLWAFYIYISGWKLSPTNYNECHVIFKQSVNQSSVTDSRPIKVFLFPSQPIRMTQFHSSNRSGVFCIHVEGKFNSVLLYHILQTYTPKQFVLIFQTKWTWLRKHTSPTDEFHLRWKQSQIAFFVASTKLSGIVFILWYFYIFKDLQYWIASLTASVWAAFTHFNRFNLCFAVVFLYILFNYCLLTLWYKETKIVFLRILGRLNSFRKSRPKRGKHIYKWGKFSLSSLKLLICCRFVTKERFSAWVFLDVFYIISSDVLKSLAG
jgi:hypothetical protein